MSYKLRYFAWLRERIGVSEEDVQSDATTVLELIEELKARGEAYELAFSNMGSLRVALDQEMAELESALSSVKEIAFFPPMTGG